MGRKIKKKHKGYERETLPQEIFFGRNLERQKLTIKKTGAKKDNCGRTGPQDPAQVIGGKEKSVLKGQREMNLRGGE